MVYDCRTLLIVGGELTGTYGFGFATTVRRTGLITGVVVVFRFTVVVTLRIVGVIMVWGGGGGGGFGVLNNFRCKMLPLVVFVGFTGVIFTFSTFSIGFSSSSVTRKILLQKIRYEILCLNYLICGVKEFYKRFI